MKYKLTPFIARCEAKVCLRDRFKTDANSILQTFRCHKADSSVNVFLYSASMEQLSKFRDTFYFAPSLKIKPGVLSRNQLLSAIKSIDFENAYLEINEFRDTAEPRVTIVELSHDDASIAETVGRFTNAQLRVSNCLLLYDVDKNKEALHQDSGHPSPNLGEGRASPVMLQCGGEGNSLDSLLASILSSSAAAHLRQDVSSADHQLPKPALSSPTAPHEPSDDSEVESPAEDSPSLPPKHPASPLLITLYIDLRAALAALLGENRATRVIRRSLSKSNGSTTSTLPHGFSEVSFGLDNPSADHLSELADEDIRSLIRSCVESADLLILNKRKAREKLAHIIADHYSRNYASFTPGEFDFLESLWTKLTK